MEVLKSAEVSAVLATAAAGLAAWILQRLYEWIAGLRREARKRREIVIRFYTDVKLRVEYCSVLGDRRHVQDAIRKYDAQKPFRAYVAQITDRSAYDQFESILYTFPASLIEAARRFIVSDRLSILMYEKLASKEFERLQMERKLAAIDAFFDEIESLSPLGRKVLREIEYLPYYGVILRQLSDQGLNRSDHG
jgi:hypothetical protein